MQRDCPDRAGHDELYKGRTSSLARVRTPSEYAHLYELRRLSPFWRGGSTKGHVRGLAVQRLVEGAVALRRPFDEISILDAGCGQGELSVYLATRGFRVFGIDVSGEAVHSARVLAERVGVADTCRFVSANLEAIPLATESCDFIIGHGALHHFIKYSGVPAELGRVLRREGEMFFADSFGENRLYHVFHDKEQMTRLGDVILSKRLIDDYFRDFEVNLYPTDWFVMLDKLFLRVTPARLGYMIRWISWLWWHLDRIMPLNRWSLALSGAVLTHVRKVH